MLQQHWLRFKNRGMLAQEYFVMLPYVYLIKDGVFSFLREMNISMALASHASVGSNVSEMELRRAWDNVLGRYPSHAALSRIH